MLLCGSNDRAFANPGNMMPTRHHPDAARGGKRGYEEVQKSGSGCVDGAAPKADKKQDLPFSLDGGPEQASFGTH